MRFLGFLGDYPGLLVYVSQNVFIVDDYGVEFRVQVFDDIKQALKKANA